MAATLVPGLERRLKAEISGDVAFDPFTRGRYATDASHYQMMPLGVVMPRTVADAERAIALARQEGVTVLARGGGTSQSGPDRQPVAGRRLLEIPQPHPRPRRGGPALRGRARHRARRPQPAAQTARPVVSGRHLDRLARHHRRHDRQQFLRRALAALRQHARERAVGRRHPGRRHARRISGRPRATSPTSRRRCARSPPISWRSARARPTRSRRAFRRCSAGSAATISMRCCPAATISTSPTSWSAPRARSASRPGSS